MNSKEDLDQIKALVAGMYSSKSYNGFDDFKKAAIDFMDKVVPAFLPHINKLSDEEKKFIINELKNDVPFSIPEYGATCAEEYIFNDKWLENSNVKFDYANRYFSYLKNIKRWLDDSIETLKKDSFDVTQMLGNPCTSKSMHRKGLMIGDVQSGKTANYTAVLNRAVDVGFNVIVLLAGTTTTLRKQTQERIDLELVGKTETKKNEVVGVGLINPKLNRISTATSVLSDYSKTIAKTQAATIQKGQTLLFVTKKNVSSLKAIIEALEKSNTAIKMPDDKLDASLLVIDDEADNASVDTRNPDKDPTSINKNIRELIQLFSRTSYLAVTATPFANIFIDDDMKKEFGDDLFPSDFITVTKRPPLYIGAREFFGDVAIPEEYLKGNMKRTYSGACNVDIKDSEMDSTYKFKHKKDVRVDDFSELPPSLQEAIRYFIIVQQLMDELPGVGKHRTMMINVSRFVDVQDNLFERIREWLCEKLVPQVRKNANYPDNGNSESSGEFHQLWKVWNDYDLETLSGMTWNEFAPKLLNHLSDVRVAVVNNGKKTTKEGFGLDYDACPLGDRVIAVGGQCLSRGLTLEGLVVSYFYRNSVAYDTLLQMGRWFGYRTAYLRYFKIWLAESSRRWYGMIAEACDDLRNQVEIMRLRHMTPSQFGLGVRHHPYSNLIVTAKNKMQNAKQLENTVITDLRCQLIETPRLLLDRKANIQNSILVKEFVSRIDIEKPKESDSGKWWKNVEKQEIIDFVRKFSSSKLSLGFSVSDLTEYLENSVDGNWDVAISQSTESIRKNLRQFEIGKTIKNCRPISRQYDIPEGEPILRVSKHSVRVGTGSVTKLGLSGEELKDLEESYKKTDVGAAYWAQKKNGYSIYLQTSETFKRNNILILYPLWLHHMDKDDCDVYNGDDLPVVWAFGLGFTGNEPATKDSQCFHYVVNTVAVANGLGISGEIEEDDIEDD